MTSVELVLGLVAGLAVAWLGLVIVLLTSKPEGGLLEEALRLLPDVIRLLRRLATDRTLARGVRVRLGLLFAYLAFPLDLIPDFLPLVGHVDDAIIVAGVLRSVVRRVGLGPLEQHWPGTAGGLRTVVRLAGIVPGPSPG